MEGKGIPVSVKDLGGELQDVVSRRDVRPGASSLCFMPWGNLMPSNLSKLMALSLSRELRCFGAFFRKWGP